MGMVRVNLDLVSGRSGGVLTRRVVQVRLSAM